jgi:hypothetical protein
MASVATYPDETGITKMLRFTCTTTALGASTGASKKIRGTVKRVYMVPGAGVSNNFTIKLLDDLGKDILDSDGNAGTTIPDASIATEWLPAKPVCSTLTCTIAGGGDAKVIVVDVFYEG